MKVFHINNSIVMSGKRLNTKLESPKERTYDKLYFMKPRPLSKEYKDALSAKKTNLIMALLKRMYSTLIEIIEASKI